MEALKFSRTDIEELAEHFEAISHKVPLRPITSDEEYDFAVRALNALLDAGAADENHRLAALADALGEFIGEYDDAHHQLPNVPAGDILKYLMLENDVRQADLPEIGSQGVVSEILSGKRELNVRQIRAVSERFGVNPAIFL
ncbi:helix-turn-helix domain-containing protein [Paraburkholderia megapolitana]|uniref:HTH-type transcriptional regulator / antitoxin HigA n=1 Tax=Paraburkholderia megapolitana TaxID=420953 RepID=A0A1I3DZD8_9BURK|nr:transcriptional regulator [Paraburkholderia megapolitana]QDQ79839.1 transcriptional regulator [Paraburkholderia megapolitana]SFH91968.1 HTH-type transcriptional regulator / antitoxin HigA [Paraburkholderia megapolitana]